MTPDPLEQEMLRQQFRPLASNWRAEILATALQTQPGHFADSRGSKQVGLSGWGAWFWPHPAAWGALAVLWLTALGFDWVAAQPRLRSAEMTVVSPALNWSNWVEYQHAIPELTELEPEIVKAASRPRPAVERPRSQLRIPHNRWG